MTIGKQAECEQAGGDKNTLEKTRWRLRPGNDGDVRVPGYAIQCWLRALRSFIVSSFEP